MTRLRVATSADFPAMMELGREMHAQSNFAPMHFDPEKIAATAQGLLDESQFVVVAEADGEIVGYMLGMILPSWFGRDYVANDLNLYVRPKHAMTAVKLIRAFVAWARMAGAKQIRPGVSTGSEAAQRLYEAYGFEPAGKAYVLNVYEMEEAA